MAKPQQPELRRSGFVPALDPDATESRLDAHDRPDSSGPSGPIPEDQRPGHHPDQEQDKPDMDKFAERLGVVPDSEEPPEAPHVDEDSKVTRLKPKAERTSKADEGSDSKTKATVRSFSPIGLALVGPVTGILIAKKVIKGIKRLRR